MKKNLAIFFILALPVFSTCKKDKTPADVITIQGFALTDGLGNLIAVAGGNVNDDWQIGNWSELSAIEQSFLNFSDNVDLTNTAVTTFHNPLAYPNPVINSQIIDFVTDDSVKLKIALVDAKGHVLRTFSRKIKGASNIAFDFSDTILFPSKKSLRYYYSFSALGQPNFKAGHGDIKVCRNSTAPFYQDCFE